MYSPKDKNEMKFYSNDFCTNIPFLLPVKDDPFKEKTLAEMGYDATNMPNWSNICQPKKVKLEQLLMAKILKYEQTNVEIHIEGTIFRCHMLVLQCYSEFFSNLTGKEQVVLPSNKVTPQSFFMLYSWMLSSDPIVGREGILELYNAAEYLKIDGVLSQCWACLDDAQISEDAAFLLYLEARQFRKSLIEELMIARIFKFFLTLVASEEFLKFSVDEVTLLLSSNSIGVHSEMEVLLAAVRWLNYDWMERSQHLIEVVQYVRFGLLTLPQLVWLKNSSDVEINEIIETVEVKDMIEDAISYIITKGSCFSLEDLHKKLKELRLSEPVERLWLVENTLDGQGDGYQPHYSTYQAFLEYLRTIRDINPNGWRKEVVRVDDEPY